MIKLTTKSRLLISSIVAICALIIIAFNTTKNNTLFYLSDKYYNTGEIIKVDENGINNLSNDSYLLFTYNSFCSMAKPCEEVFDKVLKDNKIDYYSIPIENFRKTIFHDTVKLAPSFMIIKNGKLVAYLDPEKDSDLDYFQNESDFEKWLNSHIYLKK